MSVYGSGLYGDGQYGGEVTFPVASKVEIAFTTSPVSLISAQIWVDVSSRYLSHTISRGRSDEQAEIGASTYSVVLDNADGALTPGYAAGPYYPDVELGIMIRHSVVVNAVTYKRFTGYIESIDCPEWVNSPFNKTVTIQANDRLARIGIADAMLSHVQYATLAANPTHYWPLAEGSESLQAFAITPDTANDALSLGGSAGTLEFGGGTGVVTDSAPAVKFTPITSGEDQTLLLVANNTYLTNRDLQSVYFHGTGAPVSISAWFNLDAIWTTANPNPIVVRLHAEELHDWSLTINVDAPTRRVTAAIAGTGGSCSATGPLVAIGQSVHVVAVADSGATFKLYVNGVEYVGTAVPNSTRTGHVVQVGNPFSGSISDVALFETAVSSTEVATMYAAGTVGVRGLRSDVAMASVAYNCGVPAVEFGAAQIGSSRIGNVMTLGRSGLEVLKEIADIEHGVLYIDGSGIMRFAVRGERYGATVSATIDVGEILDSIGVAFNNQFLTNDATVNRQNGPTARYVDLLSVARRFRYSKSQTINVYNDNELMSRARYLTTAYGKPRPRIGVLPLSLTTSFEHVTLLGLDIGDLIALSGLSADKPSLGNQWVEGIAESGSVESGYLVTLNTSPSLPIGSNLVPTFWRLGVTDALGTQTVLAY